MDCIRLHFSFGAVLEAWAVSIGIYIICHVHNYDTLDFF